MDPITIGLIAFAAMLGLVALHVPIGFAMALAGVGGFWALTGNFAAAVSMFGQETAGAVSSPELIIIPMFLLMGAFAGTSGLAGDMYHLANALIGHRRGGLAMATVAGCGGFGAACGSSIATTATMARIALPEMERRGYAQSLGSGCIAAGGTLGSLIPPSSIMLIYAFLTEQFVVDLFIAGIVPGLLTIAIYFAAIAFVVRRKPDVAPAGVRRASTTCLRSRAIGWRECSAPERPGRSTARSRRPSTGPSPSSSCTPSSAPTAARSHACGARPG